MNTLSYDSTPAAPACPVPPPKPNILDNSAGLATVLQSMGLGPCKTQSAAAGGFVLIPPAAIGGAESSSSGCEQVAVVASTVQQYQDVLSCIVNQTVQSSSSSLINTNDLVIRIGAHADIEGGLTVKQLNDVQVKVIYGLTDNQKTQVQSSMNDFLKQFADSLQKSKTGPLATPQGQKTVQDFSTMISQQATQEKLSQVIQQFKFDLTDDNKLIIDVGPYSVIRLSPENYGKQLSAGINITQENIVHYFAQQMMNEVLSTVFKTDEGQKVIDTFKTQQQNEAAGIDAVIKALGGLIGSLLFGWIIVLVIIFAVGGSSIMKYLLPISIVALAAGAVYEGVKHAYIPMAVMIVLMFVLSFFEYKTLTAKPALPGKGALPIPALKKK